MTRYSQFERYPHDRKRTAAEAVTFAVENEVVRVGGSVNNYDDMLAATARVLKSNPKLHEAYLEDPNQPEV